MTLAFKFRLYPTLMQERRMLDTIETCRRLWNIALADRKGAWEHLRSSTTYEQQCLMLTSEVRTNPRLREVYSQALQDVLGRLDKAFSAFFDHRARHPRFKKYRESGSFTYPQAYGGSVNPDLLRKRLYLSKVGNVRTVFHRPLPRDARLKTCTVAREPDGKWFASLVFEEIVPLQNNVTAPTTMVVMTTRAVGIDLGLNSLITTSDGKSITHPRFLRKAERRLTRLQRGFSRKGSMNRSKALHLLAVQHASVARRRMDFNHKLSRRLVRAHDLIAFEDLRIRNMVRNHRLAKSIMDASWGQLITFTEYKAARAVGKLVVRVEPAYSTQECFFCGALNQVPLDVRTFECKGCGRVLDRDRNAARIVLKRAIAHQVGQDKGLGPRPDGESHRQAVPELKPVETGSLPSRSTETASPVDEAGTRRDGGDAAQQAETRRWKPSVLTGGGCHTALICLTTVGLTFLKTLYPQIHFTSGRLFSSSWLVLVPHLTHS